MSLVCGILRVIGGTVFLVLAFGLYGAGRNLEGQLDGLPWQSPMCLPLDFSARGKYSGHYARRFNAPLDDHLRLVVAGSLSTNATRSLLDGLRADLALHDHTGRLLLARTIGADDFHPWGMPESELVVDLPTRQCGVGEGDFHVTLEVITPAARMQDRPHCIVAEYAISGLEGMSVWILFPMAAVLFVVGVIVLCLGHKFGGHP